MLAAGSALLIGACSDDTGNNAPPNDAGSCHSELPASCPAVAPSYKNQIEPLIRERCVPCHSPGGEEATKPFTTYADVYNRRGPMLNQVYACRMPPSDAAQLTASERAELFDWFICDAPDN